MLGATSAPLLRTRRPLAPDPGHLVVPQHLQRVTDGLPSLRTDGYLQLCDSARGERHQHAPRLVSSSQHKRWFRALVSSEERPEAFPAGKKSRDLAREQTSSGKVRSFRPLDTTQTSHRRWLCKQMPEHPQQNARFPTLGLPSSTELPGHASLHTSASVVSTVGPRFSQPPHMHTGRNGAHRSRVDEHMCANERGCTEHLTKPSHVLPAFDDALHLDSGVNLERMLRVAASFGSELLGGARAPIASDSEFGSRPPAPLKVSAA